MIIGLKRGLPILAALAAAIMLSVASGAYADTRLQDANKKWRADDDCNRAAFKQYPDYTTEGAAHRDAFLRQCLNNNRLLPSGGTAQPQTPTGTGK